MEVLNCIRKVGLGLEGLGIGLGLEIGLGCVQLVKLLHLFSESVCTAGKG